MPFTIHHIQTIHDPVLLPWLDLYEMSFPVNQRFLVSHLLRGLQSLQDSPTPTLLALLDDQSAFVGLVMYQLITSLDLCYLYYLAIQPERRSQGLGAAFYQQLTQRIFPLVSLLIYEVEIPSLTEDVSLRRLAERRIAFYQRQGAKLLAGIHYMQSIGPHCPPIPMHIAFHPRSDRALSPQDAFDAVVPIFGSALTQIAALAWLNPSISPPTTSLFPPPTAITDYSHPA